MSQNKRQYRFFYDDGWTRWLTDDDDLSWLVNIVVEKMEIIEQVPRDQIDKYMEQFK